MAGIFLKTSGSFSALTHQKVVSEFYTNHSGITRNAINTERYQGFTASAAGDVDGVALLLILGDFNSSYSVTVKLQELVGAVWTDRATKTLDNQALLVQAGGYSSYVWCYFEFAVPYPITTTASTWRIAVSGSSVNSWYYSGSTYNHAVVLTAATSYSSGDTVLQNGSTVVTVDQNIEANWWVMCNMAEITWGTSPAASYDLNITYFQPTRRCFVTAGTEANPIPASKKAVFYVGNFYNPATWIGSTDCGFRFYGNKPTNIGSYLSADAASGQKIINIEDDYSGDWQVGDTVVIQNHTYQTNTIASISGTQITLTSNLSSAVFEGGGIYNNSKKDQCGIHIEVLTAGSVAIAVWKMSGVEISKRLLGSYSGARSSVCEDILMDTIIGGRDSYVGFQNSNAIGVGATFRDVYSYTGSWNASFQCYSFTKPVFERVFWFCTNGTGGAGIYAQNNVGGTLTDVIVNGSNSTYALFSFSYCNNTVLNNVKVFLGASSASVHVSGSGYVFNNCSFDSVGAHAIYLNNTDAEFNNCEFGGKSTPTNIFDGADFNRSTIKINDSSAFTVNEASFRSFINSYIKSHRFGKVDDDHRSWWSSGKIVSVGYGLADTTVHTSGADRFAVRFEPTSSVDNLEFSFGVPVGVAIGQEITVSVWCKINSAAYYAGTHEKPRLTVTHDDGIVEYAEAIASTDWQQISVSFTPTTKKRSATVKLSARTDATGSDAYVYWDDFAVVYPVGFSVDFGGLDVWDEGLPLSPSVTIGGSSVIVIED